MFNKVFLKSLLVVVLGNVVIAPAFSENFLRRETNNLGLTSPKMNPNIGNWFAVPGVKAIISTNLDPGSTILIVSEGGVDANGNLHPENTSIQFKSCDCGGPLDCVNLLPPFFKFTPSEILTRTSTFKGKARHIAEIGAGILLLVGPNIPGIPGEAASLLGGLAFLGNAINPQQIASEDIKINDIANQIINDANSGILNGTTETAVIQVGDKFETIKSSFTNFLLSLGDTVKKDELDKQGKKFSLDMHSNAPHEPLNCREFTQRKLDQTNTVLGQTKVQLGQTKEELDQVKIEADQSKAELDEVLKILRAQQAATQNPSETNPLYLQ